MQRANNNQKRTQGTAVRALRVLTVLKGRSTDGLSNKAIADALGESPSAITLSLNSLCAEGFVTKLENGNFAHSIALLGIAQAHANHMSKMSNRIIEINARVDSAANA